MERNVRSGWHSPATLRFAPPSTKLAEKNPEQVVLKIAGHVSPQMLRKIYAHVRLPALRGAVDSISSLNRSRGLRYACRHEQKTYPQTIRLERQLLGRIDAVKRIFKKRHIYAGELLPSAQQAALSDLDFALMKTIRAFNEEHPGFNPSKELKAKAAGAS